MRGGPLAFRSRPLMADGPCRKIARHWMVQRERKKWTTDCRKP